MTSKQKEIIKQLSDLCCKSNCYNESMNMRDIVKHTDELTVILDECKTNGINNDFMIKNNDEIWKVIQ